MQSLGPLANFQMMLYKCGLCACSSHLHYVRVERHGRPYWRWPAACGLLCALAVTTLIVPRAAGSITCYENFKLNRIASAKEALCGGGEAAISIDMSLQRTGTFSSDAAQMDYLVLHSSRIPVVGYHAPGMRAREFCCSPALAEDPQLTAILGTPCTVNSIIVPGEVRSGADPLATLGRAAFPRGSNASRLVSSVPVAQDGVWLSVLAACDPEAYAVSASGCLRFHSRDGLLPASLHGAIPFFGGVSAAYLALGLLWTALCAYFWRDLLKVQICIAGVIGVGAVEMMLWLGYFENFNQTGSPSIALAVFAVWFQTAKKALSRLLVLAVAMGWGIVRREMGPTGYKLVLLAIFYFFNSGALNIQMALDHSGAPLTVARVILLLTVTGLDAGLAIWTFVSLHRTYAYCEEKRQTAKSSLYKKFAAALFFFVIVTGTTLVVEMLVYVSGRLEGDLWAWTWVFTKGAASEALYLLLLAIVAFLWAPTRNNTRYAYAEIEREEGEGELSSMAITYEAGPGGGPGRSPSAGRAAPFRFTLDDDDEGGAGGGLVATKVD